MFEKDLEARLKRMFDFNDCSYADPSESDEQEKLFIRIEKADVRTYDARATAKVTGHLWVFANQDKLRYGYFAKRIARASSEDQSKFIFHDIDDNVAIRNNIDRRSVGFVFFYETQYDPSIGEIDLVTIDVETT